MLPVLLLILSDFRVFESLVICDIFGPFDKVGFGASIIRTPGEDGTVPENTSTEKKQIQVPVHAK
jgi:hypothetical protein